jgi:hypothetical protein
MIEVEKQIVIKNGDINLVLTCTDSDCIVQANGHTFTWPQGTVLLICLPEQTKASNS